jgi:hypothetical protein
MEVSLQLILARAFMSRISVILVLLVASACDVGSVVPVTGGDGGSGSNCVPPGNPAAAQQHLPADQVVPGQASNQGQNCLTANCHNPAALGNGALAFTFAGTLYTTAGGTTPATGVTVRIKFGSGPPVTAVTDMDGNFYSSTAVTFPANADVTSCPTVKPMMSQLQTGNGACSSTGCHVPGGNPGPMGLM